MSDDKSILHRMEEQGRPASRVSLAGTERNENAAVRYEIVGELARGGIGAVHRGRDNDLGRDVALKVLLDRHLKSPELVQRFVEEAQIGGQLQHPGIVPVYELGLQADQRPYFAMKLVKGETLAARLARGTDSRRELIAVFREVCRTMAYAHARGVIHRDLKPANVMIGNFGEVQVVDWGFAKVLRKGGVADEGLSEKAERDVTMVSTVRSHTGSEPSVAGSVMGTPSYMPPEQALGRVEDLDERSDVFSLGAILCQILVGRPPYTGDERLNDAAQARLDPVHALLDACDADARLIALAKRCLQPLPQDRPASAETLADEVAAYLTSVEGRAHRAQVRALKAEARAAEQRRSRRLTTLVGGSVVAALVLAVGAYLWADAGRAGRERDRQAKVEFALQDASRLRKARKWPEALAAAQRAIELGDNGALARTIRAEKKRADALADQEAKDTAFLAALENARAVRGDEVDDVTTDKMYEAAVARYDVDTERLRKSPHALAFAAAFDAWAEMRRTSDDLKKSNWREVDRYARAIDPEHDALRDALIARDRDELARLAESADELPPALIGTISTEIRSAKRLELLQRALRKHPGDFWIHYRLAQAATAQKKYEKAVVHYAAALAIRPRSVEARHRLGMALESLKEYDEAIAVWRSAFAIKPDWAHGHTHIAQALEQQGNLDEAEAYHRKALLDENDPRARVGYAHFLMLREQWKECTQYLREAIDLGWTNAATFNDLAIALWRTGDHDSALKQLRRAIDEDPKDPRFHKTLGAFHTDKQDFPNAIRAYGRAHDLGSPVAARLIGDALLDIDNRKAVEWYQRALEADEKNAEARAGLGTAYAFMGRTAAARREFERAVADAPDSHLVHLKYGSVLSDHWNRQDEAIVKFRRAIELKPNDATAYGNLGIALWRKGSIDDAVNKIGKAIELGATAEFHINLGAIFCDRQGRYEAAIAEFHKALKLNPAHPNAHRNLGVAKTMLGKERTSEGKVDEAIALFREVIDAESANVITWEGLGLALHLKGELPEALAAYRTALPRHPGPDGVHAGIGGVLLAQGKTKDAIANLRRALAINPARLEALSNLAAALGDTKAAAAARARALAALRARLAAVKRALPKQPHTVAQGFARWKIDPNLAAIRAAPEFKEIWAEVDALLERAKQLAAK